MRAYAGSVSLRKTAAWAVVVLSASDGFRHWLVAANSSGRRASSAGTGDATVGAGDGRSGGYVGAGKGPSYGGYVIISSGRKLDV